MAYIVTAYRSATCCRVWDIRELRYEVMTWGPYKRLKFAKKKATELRKDRVRTIEVINGPTINHGPSFVNVKVIETE